MSAECRVHSFHADCQSVKNICSKCEYIIESFLLLEDWKQLNSSHSNIMIIADFESVYHKRSQDKYMLISFYAFQEMCWYRTYSVKYKFDEKIFWQKFMKFILVSMKSTLQRYICWELLWNLIYFLSQIFFLLYLLLIIYYSVCILLSDIFFISDFFFYSRI